MFQLAHVFILFLLPFYIISQHAPLPEVVFNTKKRQSQLGFYELVSQLTVCLSA